MTNINTQEYLTEHFSLREFIFSQTAIKNKIDNTPSPEALVNIKRLASYLEEIRTYLSKYFNKEIFIKINSGYRSKELNKLVNGVSNSAHLFGRASDVIIDNINMKEIFDIIIKACQEGKLKKFDQLIYYSKLNFIHIGISEALYEPRFNYFIKA